MPPSPAALNERTTDHPAEDADGDRAEAAPLPCSRGDTGQDLQR